jgi:hypothetical protein
MLFVMMSRSGWKRLSFSLRDRARSVKIIDQHEDSFFISSSFGFWYEGRFSGGSCGDAWLM